MTAIAVIAGGLYIAAAHPAAADPAPHTQVLTSGSGGDPEAEDPNVSYAVEGGGPAGTATIVDNSLSPCDLYDSNGFIPTAQFVTAGVSEPVGCGNNNGSSLGGANSTLTTTYTTTFTLPDGFTTPSIDVSFLADNYAHVELNGTQIGDAQPAENDFSNFDGSVPWIASSTEGSLFQTGANNLSFVVTDISDGSGFAPTGVAFVATVSYGPAGPTDLDQRTLADAQIPVGGNTDHRDVVFEAKVGDADGEDVGLQVEVAKVGDEFTGDPTATSSLVMSGDIASVTVSNPDLVADANYHWQARTVDANDLVSDWVSFGANDESATDFRVPKADLSISQSLPSSVLASNPTTTRQLVFSITVSNAGPDAAGSVTLDETFDSSLLDTSGARYDVKTATCSGVQTSVFGVGDTIGLASLASSSTKSYCISVPVLQSPAPLLNGPLTLSNTVTAASPVFDPTTPNSSTATTDVLTTPTAPTAPKAFPGNGNAYFRWSPPTSDGGSTVLDYFVTVKEGATLITSFTVPVDTCGTPGNAFLCTNVPGLVNGHTYSFTVQARNAVGLSPSSSPVTTVPSIDASAQQIKAGQLSQKTGNSSNPTSTDRQITVQDFPAGTTGVGTILETVTGANSFCGGGKCVGQIVKTTLQDPTLPGRYTITMLFDKTLIAGTGQKYTFFYDPSDAAEQGHPLPACPKNITPGMALPCVQVKLASGGANPALKAVIYTRDPDPTVGGKGFPR